MKDNAHPTGRTTLAAQDRQKETMDQYLKLEQMAMNFPDAEKRAWALQSHLDARNLPKEVVDQIKKNLDSIYLDENGNPVSEKDL